MELEVWEVWYTSERGKEICWGSFESEREADNAAAVLGQISPGLVISVERHE